MTEQFKSTTSTPDTLGSIRRQRGLSVEQVGRSINVSPEMISQYEQEPEEVPLSTAIQLSVAYDVSIDEIDFTRS